MGVQRQFTNFRAGTLDDAVPAAQQTMMSSEFADLPVVAANDPVLTISIDPDGSAPEIVHVFLHEASSTTVSVLRSREGSVAQTSTAAGTLWRHVATADHHNEMEKVAAVLNKAWSARSVETVNRGLVAADAGTLVETTGGVDVTMWITDQTVTAWEDHAVIFLRNGHFDSEGRLKIIPSGNVVIQADGEADTDLVEVSRDGGICSAIRLDEDLWTIVGDVTTRDLTDTAIIEVARAGIHEFNDLTASLSVAKRPALGRVVSVQATAFDVSLTEDTVVLEIIVDGVAVGEVTLDALEQDDAGQIITTALELTEPVTSYVSWRNKGTGTATAGQFSDPHVFYTLEV